MIILAGHGDDQGLCLPELAEEIKASYKFQNRIRPQDFATFLSLPKSIVLNISCCGGSPPMAQAFIDSGCSYYIGHPGYPDGSSSLMSTLSFAYAVLVRRKSVPDGVESDGLLLHYLHTKHRQVSSSHDRIDGCNAVVLSQCCCLRAGHDGLVPAKGGLHFCPNRHFTRRPPLLNVRRVLPFCVAQLCGDRQAKTEQGHG